MKKDGCNRVEDWPVARGLELLLSDQLSQRKGSYELWHGDLQGEANKEQAGGRSLAQCSV